MSFDLKIKSGDLQLASNGDLQKTENTEKLIQDILKILSIPLGGNPSFPWYGSSISTSLIGNAFNFQFTSSLASSQVRDALEILQKLQNVQTGRQAVTPNELLAAIQEVRVERNQKDPRYFTVIIKVLTKALTSVTTSFDITL